MQEKEEDNYGKFIHMLSKRMKYLADENLVKQNMTFEQVKIIVFLTESKQENIYQKDIEKHFEIKRSTVTSILQTMEKKDMIIRMEDETDARMKKVTLTEKGIQLSRELKDFINQLHGIIVEGFSDEEKEKFLYLLKKSIQNMSEYTLDMNGLKKEGIR